MDIDIRVETGSVEMLVPPTEVAQRFTDRNHIIAAEVQRLCGPERGREMAWALEVDVAN